MQSRFSKAPITTSVSLKKERKKKGPQDSIQEAEEEKRHLAYLIKVCQYLKVNHISSLIRGGKKKKKPVMVRRLPCQHRRSFHPLCDTFATLTRAERREERDARAREQ